MPPYTPLLTPSWLPSRRAPPINSRHEVPISLSLAFGSAGFCHRTSLTYRLSLSVSRRTAVVAIAAVAAPRRHRVFHDAGQITGSHACVIFQSIELHSAMLELFEHADERARARRRPPAVRASSHLPFSACTGFFFLLPPYFTPRRRRRPPIGCRHQYHTAPFLAFMRDIEGSFFLTRAGRPPMMTFSLRAAYHYMLARPSCWVVVAVTSGHDRIYDALII